MDLEPLEQWYCDTCGDLVERRLHGSIIFDRNADGTMSNFEIVHNGNVDGGKCQHGASRDLPLEDLDGERGLLRMLSHQSADPSWAETLRRLLVPHYEEARQYFEHARRDGVIDDVSKLNAVKLISIIKAFGE